MFEEALNMRNKIIAFVVALAAVSTVGIVQLVAHADTIDRSRDCDKYAVVYCGTMSAGEVREKYNQKDHATVFSAFGIAKSDVAGDIRKGVVYQDGRVVVGGKTVATNAVMAARHLGGTSISGSDTAKKVSVGRMSSAQEALVKFNSDGEFEWAIMTPCGNPVNATPKKVKKPVYKCESLTAKAVSRNKYSFTTDASASGGATIVNYTYDFGDGSTATSGKSTTHTYAEPGTYEVSVTVNVRVDGKVVAASGDCTTSVTVEEEKTPAITIEKTVNGTKHATVAVDKTFTYEVTVTNTGDVDLKDAKVTDKAPSQVTLVSADRGDVNGNTWTYTIDELAVGESETFEITAKYATYAGGTHKNTVCVDTPTIPGGPDACDDATTEVPEEVAENIEVCDTNTNEIITIQKDEFDASHMTKHLSECDEEEAPEELPETGAVETVGAVFGAGSLIAAGAGYIASRRSM